MVYLTRADLVDRFRAVDLDALAPVDDPDAALPSSARADAVIADTCAEIDAVLVETYALPLPSGTSWPVLTSIGADIARARLYDDEAPDRVLGRLSSARARLREIGTGDRRLVSAAGVEAPRHATVLIDAGTPVATRARLSEYLDPSPTSYGPFGQGGQR